MFFRAVCGIVYYLLSSGKHGNNGGIIRNFNLYFYLPGNLAKMTFINRLFIFGVFFLLLSALIGQTQLAIN